MKVIVIGSGHAGIEAAYAVSKMGAEAVLVTTHLETIAQMSCNPSIGGIAKGHLVKEMDALGAIMPRAADITGIHFKILNQSKGPAVRATRTQNDKVEYRNFMKNFLETRENLKIYQSIVTGILTKKNRVTGVTLLEGNTLNGDAVIVAAGTFLDGKIYIGNTVYSAGRSNEPPSILLSENIKELGLKTIRLKTGTPPRVNKNSIDWDKFEPQPGDDSCPPFSMFTDFPVQNKILCYMGYTTGRIKDIINSNLKYSPLYSGKIDGIGPRYCPSIEDKIVKFPGRDRHHIFLEPEGINNQEIYLNGLSSSLPVEVQKEILQAIPGLTRAVIMRPAYAIEYDAILPTQLKKTLECKEIENLFFAGQVNGTSGYEEAAAQGLMAGINAVLKLKKDAPFVLDRSEAYIGVLIDDLADKGVDEPYRLFTSRAEYRLRLREDNAFARLGKYGHNYKLISEAKYREQEEKFRKRNSIIEGLKTSKIRYEKDTHTLYHLLKRPQFDLGKLDSLLPEPISRDLTYQDRAYIEATIKYDGYIRAQNEMIKKNQNLARILIPDEIDYYQISGLSTEVRQKLSRLRPRNLAQVNRISGITPASINAISIYLTLLRKKK